jgi:hypothetical protein
MAGGQRDDRWTRNVKAAGFYYLRREVKDTIRWLQVDDGRAEEEAEEEEEEDDDGQVRVCVCVC